MHSSEWCNTDVGDERTASKAEASMLDCSVGVVNVNDIGRFCENRITLALLVTEYALPRSSERRRKRYSIDGFRVKV